MKALLILLSLFFTNTLWANDDFLDVPCIKPIAKEKFDYIECLNKKGVARVGNLIQTGMGEFPYPLGLADKDGNLILKNEYHHIYYPKDWEHDSYSDMSDALILVIKRDLNNNPLFGNLGVSESYGLVNKKGEFVVELGVYDEINQFYDNGLASIKKGDKYGFINTKGELVIPLMYDYAFAFDNGLATVEKDEKFGVIDTSNKTIIPFKYQYIDILDNLKKSNNISFAVQLNDNYALMNDKQQLISDFSYQMIKSISFSELFIVSKNDKYGVIDKQNKIIVPIEYDFIHDSLVRKDEYNYDLPSIYIGASKGDNTYLFDQNGKLILKR